MYQVRSRDEAANSYIGCRDEICSDNSSLFEFVEKSSFYSRVQYIFFIDYMYCTVRLVQSYAHKNISSAGTGICLCNTVQWCLS